MHQMLQQSMDPELQKTLENKVNGPEKKEYRSFRKLNQPNAFADQFVQRKEDDKIVIQMERHENNKLEPQSFGQSPAKYYDKGNLKELGMTCHHIIPDDMLSIFFKWLTTNATVNINSEFTKWKDAAAENLVDDKRQKQDKDEASLCEWMYGNIFIGPSCTLRVDDFGKSDEFDYGGYVESVKPEDAGINPQMDTLLGIYNRLKTLFKDIDNPKKVFVVADNEVRIINILTDLTNVAKKNATLHNSEKTKTTSKTVNPEKVAYALGNWINVGDVPLKEPSEPYNADPSQVPNAVIDSKKDEFAEWIKYYMIYDKYKKNLKLKQGSKGKKDFSAVVLTEADSTGLDGFYNTFGMFINTKKYKQGSPLLIAKHTYLVIKPSYTNIMGILGKLDGISAIL
ncbi:hypothetical protein [Anaeromicropila populeti]|uniref:Uncharacterized protein n=1 Tax=Anaeromicropila populeti TaxID=37658 RepID=A0A1I6IDQ0_9FIRM|nr:hypothetical protein [Anaeromicropila populeti]SFR64754.1 hypothetical protein SAMN05661086_00726 [Anaeromicropila populeti]